MDLSDVKIEDLVWPEGVERRDPEDWRALAASKDTQAGILINTTLIKAKMKHPHVLSLSKKDKAEVIIQLQELSDGGTTRRKVGAKSAATQEKEKGSMKKASGLKGMFGKKKNKAAEPEEEIEVEEEEVEEEAPAPKRKVGKKSSASAAASGGSGSSDAAVAELTKKVAALSEQVSQLQVLVAETHTMLAILLNASEVDVSEYDVSDMIGKPILGDDEGND